MRLMTRIRENNDNGGGGSIQIWKMLQGKVLVNVVVGEVAKLVVSCTSQVHSHCKMPQIHLGKKNSFVLEPDINLSKQRKATPIGDKTCVLSIQQTNNQLQQQQQTTTIYHKRQMITLLTDRCSKKETPGLTKIESFKQNNEETKRIRYENRKTRHVLRRCAEQHALRYVATSHVSNANLTSSAFPKRLRLILRG